MKSFQVSADGAWEESFVAEGQRYLLRGNLCHPCGRPVLDNVVALFGVAV